MGSGGSKTKKAEPVKSDVDKKTQKAEPVKSDVDKKTKKAEPVKSEVDTNKSARDTPPASQVGKHLPLVLNLWHWFWFFMY